MLSPRRHDHALLRDVLLVAVILAGLVVLVPRAAGARLAEASPVSWRTTVATTVGYPVQTAQPVRVRAPSALPSRLAPPELRTVVIRVPGPRAHAR
jgi:hypothetical protein